MSEVCHYAERSLNIVLRSLSIITPASIGWQSWCLHQGGATLLPIKGCDAAPLVIQDKRTSSSLCATSVIWWDTSLMSSEDSCYRIEQPQVLLQTFNLVSRYGDMHSPVLPAKLIWMTECHLKRSHVDPHLRQCGLGMVQWYPTCRTLQTSKVKPSLLLQIFSLQRHP